MKFDAAQIDCRRLNRGVSEQDLHDLERIEIWCCRRLLLQVALLVELPGLVAAGVSTAVATASGSTSARMAGTVLSAGSLDLQATANNTATSTGVGGYGSILVNGVRYDISQLGAAPVDDDGRPRDAASLQLGTVVRVEAGPIDDSVVPPRAVARAVAVKIAQQAKDFSSKFPTISISKNT